MSNNTPWEVLALRLVNVAIRDSNRKASMRRIRRETFSLEARAHLKEEEKRVTR
jgi:hypothetical protein